MLIIYLLVRSPKKKERPEAREEERIEKPKQPPEGEYVKKERIPGEALKQKGFEKRFGNNNNQQEQ